MSCSKSGISQRRSNKNGGQTGETPKTLLRERLQSSKLQQQRSVVGSQSYPSFKHLLVVLGGFACLTFLPALEITQQTLKILDIVPQVAVEVLHTVYTCSGYRWAHSTSGQKCHLAHNFLASLLTSLAGSLVASAVLQEYPSLIINWKQVVPWRLVLPWVVVNLIPDSLFTLYSSSVTATGVRGLINMHEALNKYRGIHSAVLKAGSMSVATTVIFVSARGAASSTSLALDTALTHPAKVTGCMRGVVIEHLRYAVLCGFLMVANSVDYHPAKHIHPFWQQWMCRSDALRHLGAWSSSICTNRIEDHVCQGTRAIVLAYLLLYYGLKAFPKLRIPLKQKVG